MNYPNLIDKWSSSLPPSAATVVAAFVAAAEARNLKLYLVGGPVRDLLLDRPSLDIDLVLAGDATLLAREVAGAAGLKAVTHPAFLTATIHTAGAVIDVATARSEMYTRPGALPTVSAADLGADLRRRDFTINAMALALNGARRGELLDPTGGGADLHAGLVRVLHDGSFRDDATRILRAVRYEQRFRFRLEEHTLSLLAAHLSCLDTISGARLRQEIVRTLAERLPEAVVLRLQALGVLAAIHPGLAFSERQAQAFRALRDTPGPLPAAYWAVLAWDLAPADVAAVTQRLSLTRAQAALLAAVPPLREAQDEMSSAELTPARVTEILSLYPPAAVRALAAVTNNYRVREHSLNYLDRLRGVKPALTGTDVLALGANPGPQVGEVLHRLRVAKLNGEVTTRADEERLVKRLLSE